MEMKLFSLHSVIIPTVEVMSNIMEVAVGELPLNDVKLRTDQACEV